MKIEKIIKILLIFGIIYLLLNSICTENFTNDSEKIRLALLSYGKTYRFVSFLDLKDEYKMLLLKDMYEQYKTELDKNLIVEIKNQTADAFLTFGGKEDTLIQIIENAEAKAKVKAIDIAKAKAVSTLVDIIPDAEAEAIAKAYFDETIMNELKIIKPDKISKMPIIIIDNDKFDGYTNSTNIFKFSKIPNDKGLSPAPDKYLFWNPVHNMLFSHSNYNLKFEIKGINKTETNSDGKIKNKFEIELITESITDKEGNIISTKDITPTRLVEKTIKSKSGNSSFIHYVLSNNDNEGKSFIWKWYTENILDVL